MNYLTFDFSLAILKESKSNTQESKMQQLIPNQIYKIRVSMLPDYYAFAGIGKIGDIEVREFYDFQYMTGIYQLDLCSDFEIPNWRELVINRHPLGELNAVELNVLGGLIFTLLGEESKNYHLLKEVWENAIENSNVKIFNDLLLKFHLLRQWSPLKNKSPNSLSILLYKATNITEAILQVYF